MVAFNEPFKNKRIAVPDLDTATWFQTLPVVLPNVTAFATSQLVPVLDDLNVILFEESTYTE